MNLNYTNIILGCFQYALMYYFLKRYQTKKLAANSCSLFHASSTVILWLMGSVELVKYNTQGYFIFDTLQILTTRNFNISNISLLYHHIAGTYYLSLCPNKFNWFTLAGVGELGNLPNYFVYYMLKANPKSVYMKKMKLFQKVWFGGIRIIPCTIITYNEVKDLNKLITLLPIIPLYFLGLAWTAVMFAQ